MEFSLAFKVLDFVIFWVELDGWVSSDAYTVSFVGGGIKLGNNEVWNIFEVLGKVLPNWGKSFAMSAPWCVELDEYILGGVECDFLECLADNNCVCFSLLWNWVRLEERLKFVVLEVLDERTNVIDSHAIDVTFISEFGHVLGGIKNSNTREHGSGNAYKF